ncbi:MAG TPA: alpha/beta hydrolase [Caulobacteraceae bacterium]|jgi:pimeloyl-ACP methyl ester carboxylesterase|nr:alpha/beta hydrolase [Caulobacteraceae bacterium]
MDAIVAYQPRAREVRLETEAGPGEFAYLDFGPDERPVDAVFSHANGFNARTYRTILAALAGELRILALDLRGHGRTRAPTSPEGRRSWLDLGDDLIVFLDTLDLKDVVLAGHSMGGTLSLFTAAERPERVRALALFDPVILPPDRPAGAVGESPLIHGATRRRRHFDSREAAVQSYRGRGAFTTWPEAMLLDYAEDGFRDLADGTVELACAPDWEASNYTAQAHDPWDAFARSRCPIRILRAETASTCNVDGRIDQLTADGRIRIETVPGTTHFLPMERPDLVKSTLRAAIET